MKRVAKFKDCCAVYFYIIVEDDILVRLDPKKINLHNVILNAIILFDSKLESDLQQIN